MNNECKEQEIVNANQERKILNSKFYTNSILMSADTINKLHGQGRNLDLTTLVEELRDSGKRLNDGNMKEVERMLIMQAKTLDYVFHDALSKLSDLNMINQIEAFANIALRAQSQSRKTLIALTDLLDLTQLPTGSLDLVGKPRHVGALAYSNGTYIRRHMGKCSNLDHEYRHTHPIDQTHCNNRTYNPSCSELISVVMVVLLIYPNRK